MLYESINIKLQRRATILTLFYMGFYTITLRNFVVQTLSIVGNPLSGNGCGSPNHIQF